MQETIGRKSRYIQKKESTLDRSMLLSPELVKVRVDISQTNAFSAINQIQTDIDTMRKGFKLPKTKPL
jgi:hypothetical protein